jgi:hypothetical protein
MSSPSPSRSRRRRPAALLAAGLALLILAVVPQAFAADTPLPVAAVLPGPATTTLVLDLSAGSGAGHGLSVTRDGKAQQATLAPVLSDAAGIALIVDDSQAGMTTLPAWSSAAARFILEAPGQARSVVISAALPAHAVTGVEQGPVNIVRALTSMQAHSNRDTATALTLASEQFPGVASGHRVALLYTAAADANGPDAATLAARLRAAGTMLVVVGSAAGSTYWTAAAEATGGFFAPAGDPVVVPALDQVQTTLAGRYLVELPTPADGPAHLQVKVSTADATFSGPAEVPAVAGTAAAQPPSGQSRSPRWWLAGSAAVLVLVGAAILLWALRRRSRPVPPVSPGAPAARGRASVPPPGSGTGGGV